LTAAPGGTSRRPGVEPSSRARGVRPLLLLLAAGLLFRFLIAYVLLPGSGFQSDLSSFTAWSLRLAEQGPGEFYATAGFADYPPGYLYVLWLVGSLAELIAPVFDASAVSVAGGLIKLPPMLADIGVGLVLFLLVRGWVGLPHGWRLGMVAAGIYLFNPVTWYDSAIWGQTDAVGALVMLLGVAALLRGNSEGAATLAVLAALVKPQFGVVFAPLVAVVLLRRHLLLPGSGPNNRPWVPAALRPWFSEERGVWRLLSSAVVGLLVLFALIIPFSLDLPGFIQRMAETAGGYPYLSVNAYNPWALIGSEGRMPLADRGGWSSDSVPLLGSIPGVLIGGSLLVLGFLVGLLRVGWRDDRRSIVLVAIFLAMAFFVLPTRVHERYLFPVFALLPLLAVLDRRWLWATVVLSIASFINLHGVLTTELYATPNLVNLPLGAFFREPIAIQASVLLHGGVFVFVLWRMRPAAAAEPDGAASEVEAGPGQEVKPVSVAPAPLSAVLASVRPTLARLTDVVPLRRDRSTELVAEPGGRLGRLDLLLVLVVLLSTLALRTNRLEEPYSMHFDEVYHARTGIEFLQHWQYGMPHSIYEYTHPHMAKYLIALGVQNLGNNRVTGVRELDVPVRAAATQTRWSPADAPNERHGDFIFVLSGTELHAYDLAVKERVGSISVTADLLAVDEDGHTLYLADRAGGIWHVATEDFDALRAGPASEARPVPGSFAQLEGVAGSLERLTVTGGRLVAITSDGTLLSLDPLTGEELARATVPGAVEVVAVNMEDGEGLAVAAASGFVLLDVETLDELHSLTTSESVSGMALATEGVERPTLYGAVGNTLQTVQLPSDDAPSLGTTLEMPNVVSDVYWNASARLIHALGRSPDGDQPTVYVVETHSNSVFADARLAFEPLAVVLDVQPSRPAQDRADLLLLAPNGSLATVDIGSNAFAWRFPGVVAGSLLAVLIYLLARFLFRRRSVAIIAWLLVLADGMFFANARIAMNDTYVALFIVAALTLFAPLWLRRWRSGWAVAGGLVGVGILLGLALATKWVAAYAIGAIGLLILLRSALGRLLALIAMIGLTALLGQIAIAPPPDVENPQLNYLFLLLMTGLTMALAAGMALRPVRMSMHEVRLAVLGPGVIGVLLLAVGAALLVLAPDPGEGALITPSRLIFAGTGMIVLANVVYAAFRLAGRYGLGPFAGPRPSEPGVERAAPPPPRGWLRPGSGRLGLSWIGALVAVTVIPLVVYTASYLPWVELGNRWNEGLPAGNSGQTFADLQVSMYDYHNYLRATHAASSPWWAWPLDLKPVWFEQEDYANSTTAVIYDTGNLVIFWLAIPAVAFVAFQAWRRRSLALGFLVLAICCLWLPWARIDRAAFQYHIFTTLPFSFLALAYFLAELWHGPSGRTWLLARVAAAGAIVAPALLWLLRGPLCATAGVERVNAGAEVCGEFSRQLVVTDLQLVGVIVAGGSLALVGVMFWLGDRAPRWLLEERALLLPLVLPATVGGLVIVLAGAVLPATPIFEGALRGPDLPALLYLFLMALPAYYVLRARDARRFVVGAVGAAWIWFLLWYPNFGGLPMPRQMAHIHLGVLPTWNYSFQFAVNQDEPSRAPPDMLMVVLLASAVAFLALGAIYTVHAWRVERAEGQALRALGEPG
jgi:Gpi18-like mannosyltransferase